MMERASEELARFDPLVAEFVTGVEGDIESLTVPREPTVAPIAFRRLPEPDLMGSRCARDGSVGASTWQRLVLPSVDLYMTTIPQRRTDVIVSGRGCGNWLGDDQR
jgi:hypothetical protein